MQQLTLRQAVMMRVQDKDESELKEIITDSVGSQEQALPGLGVLFEVIWDHSGDDVKNQLVSTLSEHVPK